MRNESDKWLRTWVWCLIAVVVMLIYLYSSALDVIDWQESEIARLQEVSSVGCGYRMAYGGER